MEMSRLTRDGTAEPVSRYQILKHARGQGNMKFPCSADHEQDWQRYPVDPYSAICDDHTYIHTPSGQSRVYRVTQLRTDGVHCGQSAGTGPVVLEIVPVTGAALAGLIMAQLKCASLFPFIRNRDWRLLFLFFVFRRVVSNESPPLEI